MLEQIINTQQLNKFFINEDEIKVFTKNKELFDYQIDAIQKTLKFFELVYQNHTFDTDKLYNEYLQFGIDIKKLQLEDSFIEDERFSLLFLNKTVSKIDFKYLLNRCSYWMATGSGKTLLMIKLVFLIHKFIKAKKLPQKNILLLAPSDSIIEQIKSHFEEYNSFSNDKIELKSLKDYDGEGIYIYRADNIVATSSKEKQLNYQDFYDNGNWFLILDEAHKGDKDDSIKQKIFTLLTKNGLLFNFSATFTDEIDKITTIKDFKLDKFLNSGYGKKIALLKSSVSSKEKYQKNSIAKSLILLSAIKKEYSQLKPFYNPPLMLVLANSVNIENSDLKQYFIELLKIIKGDFEFEKLKDELLNELDEYLFGLGSIKKDILKTLSLKDFYQIFNSNSPSTIEISKLLGNSDELVFKLKNSDEYFMLINASNIDKWNNNFLDGYEITESIEESVFKNLHKKENISILMGSRKFIEGWDSNRPNIINFVNLGTNKEAQKLVLQAIGRGVRIEPFKNYRKRLNQDIYSDKEIISIKSHIKNINSFISKINFIESLFIFPSKFDQVDKILNSLKDISNTKECKKFELPSIQKDLCYPKFEHSNEYNDKPFKISQNDKQKLEQFLQNYDDITLILKYSISLRTITKIKENHFKLTSKNKNKNIIELLKDIDRYFNTKLRKFVGFEIVDDNIIKHHKQMCAMIDNIKTFQQELTQIIQNKKCPADTTQIDELKKILNNDYLPDETKKQIEIQINQLQKSHINSKFFPKLVECKVLLQHYYIPILYKKNSNEFRHIIKIESEIEFLEKLITKIDILNQKYDEWYFSKLEENIDEITIPYFDEKEGNYRNFSPDFIFWLKKDNKTSIIFIDPKGIEHTLNAKNKIEGFEEFKKEIKNFDIKLYFYNKNNDEVDSEKKDYWKSDLDEIFNLK